MACRFCESVGFYLQDRTCWGLDLRGFLVGCRLVVRVVIVNDLVPLVRLAGYFCNFTWKIERLNCSVY